MKRTLTIAIALCLSGSLTAGEPTRPHDLIEALASADRAEVNAAEKQLLAMKAQAAPLLRRALAAHATANVRARSAALLGRMRDKTSQPDLIKALTDPELIVRRAAIEALGRLGGDTPAKALIALLTDKETLIRADAVLALGRTRHASAVKPLLRSMGDDEAIVRARAAFAIGGFDHPLVVPALIEGLEDEDPGVRAKSLLSLKRITKQTHGFAPKSPAADRDKAIGRWLAWWKKHRAK